MKKGSHGKMKKKKGRTVMYGGKKMTAGRLKSKSQGSSGIINSATKGY